MQNCIQVFISCLVILIWTSPCRSQHMCNVERWIMDNQVPINKLDLSSASKTKLVQSFRSEKKLIKCSELRLIHKEAELDRPFKQNQYKVKQQKAEYSRGDSRRDDGNRDPENYRQESEARQRGRRSDERDDDQSERRHDRLSDIRYNERRDPDYGNEHDQQHNRNSEVQKGGMPAEDIQKEPTHQTDQKESESKISLNDHESTNEADSLRVKDSSELKNQPDNIPHQDLQTHEYQSKIYIDAQHQSADVDVDAEKGSVKDDPIKNFATNDNSTPIEQGTESATQVNPSANDVTNEDPVLKKEVTVNSTLLVNKDSAISSNSSLLNSTLSTENGTSATTNTTASAMNITTTGLHAEAKSASKSTERQSEQAESKKGILESTNYNIQSTEPNSETTEPEAQILKEPNLEELNPERTEPMLESTESKLEITVPVHVSTASDSDSAESKQQSTDPIIENKIFNSDNMEFKPEYTERKPESKDNKPDESETKQNSADSNPESTEPKLEITPSLPGNTDSKTESLAFFVNSTIVESSSTTINNFTLQTNESKSTNNGTESDSSNATSQKSMELSKEDMLKQSTHSEVEMTTRLKQYFNEGFNRTKSLKVPSGTNRTQHVELIRRCNSSPRESISWKLCYIFFTKPSANLVPKQSGKRYSWSVTTFCQQSLSVHVCPIRLQNRSVHICEAIFSSPIQKQMKTNPGLFEKKDVLSNSTKSLLLQTESSIKSCLQCPAIAALNATAVLRFNKTRLICFFLALSHRQSPQYVIKQIQHASLADKLQFIDDPAVVPRKSEAIMPAAGGELQDTELPTRARQSTSQTGERALRTESQTMTSISDPTAQKDQPISNQTETMIPSSDSYNVSLTTEPVNHSASKLSSSTLQANLSKVTHEGSVGPDNRLKMEQQIDILSHSAFMEKLFDLLMTKQRPFDDRAKAHRDNLTDQLDRLNSRLDSLVNITAQKTNRSEAGELRTVLLNVELKLNSALDKFEQRNQDLLDQIRRLEMITSSKISACHRQLRRANFNVKSMAQRQTGQLTLLARRITQMAKNIRHIERKCNKTVPLLPAIPPVLQPTLECRQPTSHLTEHSHHVHAPTATLTDAYQSIDDCSDLYEREKRLGRLYETTGGVFPVSLGLPAPQRVRCDLANGGWTYILSRSNGSTEFFRNWTSYKAGFGDPAGEYFIGLDGLARMTSRRRYKLWVVLEDWEGSTKNVAYGQFLVQDEKFNYQLHVDQFNGDPVVGDSLSSHSNASFSTFDFDNDLVESKFGGNCAQRFRGGFWYFSCFRANPTGMYYPGGRIPDKRCDGIVWKTWKGPHYSLKSFYMKIKPV